MRSATLAVLVLTAVALGVARLRHPTITRPAPVIASSVAPTPAPPTATGPDPASVADRGAVVEIAGRWVEAMWTRTPGAAPFAWLRAVADITSPDLLARLGSARPTADDQQSSTVTIDGIYPDALDPAVVTVTCVAHIHTSRGSYDEPCATTVTVTAGADGRPVVAAAA